MALPRPVAVGLGVVIIALLVLSNGSSSQTGVKKMRAYDPREMQSLLGDQEKLRERITWVEIVSENGRSL